MRDSHNHLTNRWLDAEARGEEAAAERAFAQLFAALPRPAAPAGFADRVMARMAGELARPAWPLERAALWLLAVCAAALYLVPRWLPELWDRLAPETWIGGLATLLVRTAHAVAALLPLWEGFARVARWVALAAGSPQVLAAVALCALLAATAGRLLLGVLDERSASHAQVG
ncbi:MAG TPA: hypothetical protein VGS57_01540 [Thermoanaerobaculia bacterium]|jgi:hypothetical protein|nr:hypothetical protein [Thermoanaerobaculia bacterium]